MEGDTTSGSGTVTGLADGSDKGQGRSRKSGQISNHTRLEDQDGRVTVSNTSNGCQWTAVSVD